MFQAPCNHPKSPHRGDVEQPPLGVHRHTRSRSAPPCTRGIENRTPNTTPVNYRTVATQTGAPPSPITDEYEGLDVTIADEDLINFDSDLDRTQGNSCYELYGLAREEKPDPVFEVTFGSATETHKEFHALRFRPPRLRTPSPPRMEVGSEVVSFAPLYRPSQWLHSSANRMTRHPRTSHDTETLKPARHWS